MDTIRLERELRRLRDRADAEIARLADERAQLDHLIDLVGETASTSPRARPKPRLAKRRRATVLDLIGQRPGIRTSMLAMATGRSSEEIAAELADREVNGTVERLGLGWRIPV